jgi:hypothetical protein
MFFFLFNIIMTSYTFENTTRIGTDAGYVNQNYLQNMAFGNYLLNNYFSNDCTMNKPVTLATQQPGVNYKGGYQTGAGGCNIDYNTKLMTDTIPSHPRGKLDLMQRPFATVPYLGRGYVDPITESRMMQGDYNYNRKSSNNTTERSYIPYSATPLLPDIKERLTNPVYSVEGVAAGDWVRGGVPSRELTRDISKPA